MKANDILTVLIEGFDKDGKGIAYHNKKIIFVEGALEGEICEIRITKVLSKLIQAEILNIIKPSPNRIDIDCKIYDDCGGCNLRHLSYDTEKVIKFSKVKNTIDHISKQKDYIFNNLVSDNNIYNYRNKAIIPFAKYGNEIVCGMYKARSHEVIDNTNCLIEPILLNKILNIVKNYLIKENISIYDEITKKGIFRALMCRKTKDNLYMIVLIVTKYYDFSKLIKNLKEIENIKSIYLNINTLNNNVLLTDNNILINGLPYIKEDILGIKYKVSPNTFLQVNNNMAELLYKEVLRLLKPNNTDTIIDAYCGMGSITLAIAPLVKEVIGIEVVKSAIEDAKENAKLNNIGNASFVLGKCEDKIEETVKSKEIDAMVFDPPRKGCDSSFLDVIKKSKIKKIVYVSCNVATLARDILYLSELYKLEEVTPFDLFPRTSHVETVALLTLY